MATGLERTFQYLAHTDTLAAVELLEAALDCPYGPVRELALTALLTKPNRPIHRRIFARLGQLDTGCRRVLAKRPDRLISVVTEIFHQVSRQVAKAVNLAAKKRQTPSYPSGSARPEVFFPKSLQQDFLRACEAVREFSLYEAAGSLIQALDGLPEQFVAVGANTVLELTKAFYGELSAGQDSSKDLKTLRTRLTQALQEAVNAYSRHRRKELVEAFLILAKPEDVVLRRILHNRQEAAHEVLVGLLTESGEGGVIRLVLAFLEDPQAPQAVLDVLAQRTDARFVQIWAQEAGYPVPDRWKDSLARIRRIAWAEVGHPVWAQLDGKAQAGCVGLLIASRLHRTRVLELLEYLLQHGLPEARRTAAAALRELPGPNTDRLIVHLLQDTDPYVQAEAIRLVRSRNIPNGLSLLVALVDSAEPVVHQALREAMPEFTCKNFLRTFEHLPEELRQTAGYLVRKLEDEAPRLLVEEMQSLSPLRRRRAIEAASAMGAVPELEAHIILLLQDEDHRVRIAAARALADSQTQPTWQALRDALFDRSLVVREEAEKSLRKITTSLAGLAEPPPSASGEAECARAESLQQP